MSEHLTRTATCMGALANQLGTANAIALAINGLAEDVHTMAKEKGWWPEDGRNDGECLALMHSELSEALEALRAGNGESEKPLVINDIWQGLSRGERKLTGLEEELADLVLRVLDFAAAKNLNLGAAILCKMAFNATRPSRHGKQF